MQFVFDAPVLADHGVQPHGIGSEAGDVVTDFALHFARSLVVAFALDTCQSQ